MAQVQTLVERGFSLIRNSLYMLHLKRALDNFVALIGAFCSVPLAIIYPVVMHSWLSFPQPHPRSVEGLPAPLPPPGRANPPHGQGRHGEKASGPHVACLSLTPFERLSNIVVGILGVAICVLSSAYAIWTWPRVVEGLWN